MDSENQNSNNESKRANTGPIVEDIGEDSPSDQTIRKIPSVDPEDVHLALTSRNAAASTETGLVQYRGSSTHQEMPPCLQDFITSAATGKQLATLGQQVMPFGSDSNAVIQSLSNVSNAVVAGSITMNVHKTKNVVAPEGSREPTALTNLIARTKKRLEKLTKETTLVETRAATAARDKLKAGWVVIDGPCKSGKTCVGFHLLNTFDERYIPLYVTKDSELKTILDLHTDHQGETSKQKALIIFVDEILKPNMHESLKEILEQVSGGVCHLILTTSSEERKQKHYKEFDFILKKPNRMVRLMDYPLQENERYELFKCSETRLHWLNQKSEGMREFLVQEIAKVTDYPWYLQILQDLESTKRGSVDVVDFFSQPTSFLENIFKNMFDHNMEKFLSLVIIMSQGYLTDSKKCDPQSPHYDMYSALKTEYENEMPSMKKLRDRADDMKGEFLLLADNKFVFIHGSIIEPLCRVFFSEHPDLGIDWCPLPFLISMTTTGNSSVDDPIKLKLSKDEEDLLVQRFSRESPSNLFEILKHPGFSDPQFHEKCIKDLPIVKELHYSDILMQAITLKQMPLVKEILKYLRNIGSKGSGIKLSALEKACKVGNYEAFCELIDVGVEPNHACMEACQHGKSEKILSYLLNHFGRHSSLLSHDVICIQSDIIAEVGHAGMIKTLIDQLQGREDRPQLLERMLKKIVSLGSVDKYHFLIENCDKTSLNYKDLLIAASTGSDDKILSDLLKSFDNHVAASDESQDIIKELYLEACKANNKAAAKLLHDRDKGWATHEENVTKALHFAASVGFKQNPTTLMWLLKQCHNSGKDLTDSSGSTALHTACLAGNIESVNALLKADFNPMHQDNHGNTPLHVHFMGDFINQSIVEKLLWQDKKLRRLLKTKEENEAKEKNMLKMLSLQNSDGDTPLHLLCRKMNSLNMPILNMMLKNKKVTNLQNKEGKMPLHELIASNGCTESVSALLQSGAKLDMPGNQLQSIVHLACQFGNDSTIKNIFKAAKEARNVVECLDFQRKTPLHCYVSHPGSPEIVKLLCTEKTVAASDENGLTALDIAVSVCGNVEVVRELLKHGARTKYEDKASVLHHLCNSAHEDCQEMARLLIDKGADVNAVDQDLKTPLHIAASSSGPEGHSLVKLLLKQADIWKKDSDGMNPIHCCCSSSCQESSLSLKVLLDHTQIQRQLEAALTARANHGDTPLHMVSISSGKYRIEIARMLIEEGADVSLTNFDGDSALDLSKRQENTDLTMLLTEALLINACKEEDKLSHAERILSRQHDLFNTRDILNLVFCTMAQTDGKYTRSVLEMLIIRGADVKFKTDEGCTFIHLAASTAGEYAVEIIAYLISKGIDVSEKDFSGQTAIHKVCCGKTKYCKDLISFLHQQGVTVEDRDHMGNTPLHTLFGSLGDHYQECLEELLVLMVDPNVCAKNCEGISPCDMAKVGGPAVLRTFFDAYCSNVETLRQRPLKSFLTFGVNLNTKDEEGNTVLHKICKKKMPQTYDNVYLLLNLGADRTLCNKKDETACDVARETGLRYDVIEMLEPEVLDTDGASISPQSPRPQQALPCPEWFQRSPSNEGWQHDLRRGMQGIREAAGMRYFDNSMDEFEKQARWKLNNHFDRFM